MIKRTITLVLVIIAALPLAAQVSYNMVGPVQYPDSLENEPAQLNQDGKLLFIPLQEGKKGTYLYQSRRKKLGKVFEEFVKLEGLPNGVIHPTVDAKGTTVVFVNNENGGWDKNDLFIATRKNSKAAFTGIRKLDEVNSADGADAYPFLTADGLELFFFRDSGCFYTNREKTSDTFSTPVPFVAVNNLLDSLGNNGRPSIWVSKKGKTLMVFDGKQVYRADRKNSKEAFTNFTLYVAAETFDGFDFISAITFTEDLSEFYIFNSPEDGRNQLLWFRKSKY